MGAGVSLPLSPALGTPAGFPCSESLCLVPCSVDVTGPALFWEELGGGSGSRGEGMGSWEEWREGTLWSGCIVREKNNLFFLKCR